MESAAGIVLLVLLVLPLLIVGVLFVWAAHRDGDDDEAIQHRLGVRRSTRLGR